MFVVYYLFEAGEIMPFYVGKTTDDRVDARLREHRSDANTERTPKANKIRSILRRGGSVEIRVVATVSTDIEANEIERALIMLHGRKNDGSGVLYNLTDGGEGTVGIVLSEETRQRMSAAKIGNKINAGRKRPDMTERFSKPISAYGEDGEWMQSFSSARAAQQILGISFSNISAVLVGRNRCARTPYGVVVQFRFGDSVDPIPAINSKQRAMKYKIIQANALTGEPVASFRTAKEAMRITGITGVANCLCGALKTAGGFIWRKEPIEQTE